MSRNFGILARRWLFSVLGNDPVLKSLGVTYVGEHPAPPGTDFPFITWSGDMPFMPSQNVSERTLHATGQMRIRVTQNTRSFEDLSAIADRINVLLDQRVNEPIPTGGWLLTCNFQREHSWVEDRTIANAIVPFRSLGGVYRLRIQPPSSDT